MSASHEHEFSSELDKLGGTRGERCFVVVGLGETAHLQRVRRDDRRLRQQELAHRILHLLGREFVAAA
jgi:hypothetical protein